VLEVLHQMREMQRYMTVLDAEDLAAVADLVITEVAVVLSEAMEAIDLSLAVEAVPTIMLLQ